MVALDLEALMTAEAGDVVTMYAGDFLAGDIDEPWAAGARDEARARFTTAAHDLLAAVDRTDEDIVLEQAEAVARQLIDLDRWDEMAHRFLIRQLHDRGLDGDARRAHDAYSAAMEEIDVEVDPLETLRKDDPAR